MSVTFRSHRGSLAESMETAHEISNRAALVAEIAAELAPFGRDIVDRDVTVEPYYFDDRIGWDTWIVSVRAYGVAGFTNGPLSDDNP